jgi:hypothetical protein
LCDFFLQGQIFDSRELNSKFGVRINEVWINKNLEIKLSLFVNLRIYHLKRPNTINYPDLV